MKFKLLEAIDTGAIAAHDDPTDLGTLVDAFFHQYISEYIHALN